MTLTSKTLIWLDQLVFESDGKCSTSFKIRLEAANAIPVIIISIGFRVMMMNYRIIITMIMIDSHNVCYEHHLFFHLGIVRGIFVSPITIDLEV